MPTFYSEYNKREVMPSPDFNRTRHAFRGPRSSFRTNIESEQMRYSLAKINDTNETFATNFASRGDALTEGATIAVKYNSDVNPDEILEGLEATAARIRELKIRLESLDRG